MRTGIILAGGKSTRFRTDKALALLDGKPLVRWVAEALSGVTDELVISVASRKDGNRYASAIGRGVKIAVDSSAGIGPIAGLLSSFSISSGDYVAVAPCDAPFIKPALYELLFEMVKGKDGAVPKIGENYEPLIAVYRRIAMLDALKKVLSEGKSRPVNAYRYIDIAAVSEKEIRKIDSTLGSFINVNTKEDLRRFARAFKTQFLFLL
jgi:molybdopterin-guanine dinucleotide biosynthesis protein A